MSYTPDKRPLHEMTVGELETEWSKVAAALAVADGNDAPGLRKRAREIGHTLAVRRRT